MAKFFIGVLALIISTLVGHNFSLKQKRQLEFYEEFKRFNSSLKRNIQFRKDNLINLLNYDCKNDDFICTLKSAKLIITGISKEEICLPEYITDKDFFNRFFCNIGYGNGINELNFLCEYEDELNEKLLKIKDNYSKLSSLYDKLGFSFGMVVMILIL